MKRTLFILILLYSHTLAAQTFEADKAIKIGEEVSKALLSKLQSHLKEHMQKGGPLEAVFFCNAQASRITQEVQSSFAKNISVKRVSLKPRNPANAPSKVDSHVLSKLSLLHAQKKLPPFMLIEGNNSMTYYKPLLINKEICLKCHGEISNSSPMGTFLAEHYPQDKALGYRLNELRGAVVVEIGKTH